MGTGVGNPEPVKEDVGRREMDSDPVFEEPPGAVASVVIALPPAGWVAVEDAWAMLELARNEVT